MMQVLYFYVSPTRRLRMTQVDSIAMLTEQQLSVQFGPGRGQWADGKKWHGIEVSESDAKPDIAGTSNVIPLSLVPQRNTEDAEQQLLASMRVAVRALECIHRFTRDNYARDALTEIEKVGWPVDWEGGSCRKHKALCNIEGCNETANEGRGQCRLHDK